MSDNENDSQATPRMGHILELRRWLGKPLDEVIEGNDDDYVPQDNYWENHILPNAHIDGSYHKGIVDSVHVHWLEPSYADACNRFTELARLAGRDPEGFDGDTTTWLLDCGGVVMNAIKGAHPHPVGDEPSGCLDVTFRRIQDFWIFRFFNKELHSPFPTEERAMKMYKDHFDGVRLRVGELKDKDLREALGEPPEGEGD